MATKHPLDGTGPSSNAGGGPPALKPEHIAILHDIVTERAQASLQEIADELHHRCGLRVCDATIRRALRAQGIARLKPVRRAYAERAESAKRYGYTAAHRREDVSPYSTNLTDAEWELVADLFERVPGQRGTPVHYSRRDLVDACSYVLRTGCDLIVLVPRKRMLEPPSNLLGRPLQLEFVSYDSCQDLIVYQLAALGTAGSCPGSVVGRTGSIAGLAAVSIDLAANGRWRSTQRLRDSTDRTASS